MTNMYLFNLCAEHCRTINRTIEKLHWNARSKIVVVSKAVAGGGGYLGYEETPPPPPDKERSTRMYEKVHLEKRSTVHYGPLLAIGICLKHK